MNKMVRRILIILLIALIAIQFYRIDKNNPEVVAGQDFIEITNPPAEIRQILTVACYDCHSHETVYPWYTNIAPFSFWIKGHINEGRHHLNFSEWGTYTNKRAHHKLEECYEEVEEGHMPLPSYTWIHKDAVLTDVQRDAMATWFKEQMPAYENFEE